MRERNLTIADRWSIDSPSARAFQLVLLLAAIFIAKFIVDGRRTQGYHLQYDLVPLAVNYFQFGAMRRGLVGSIVYLSGIDLVTAAYLLYATSFVLTLTFAAVFLRRIAQAGGAVLPFVLVLGALLLFWSEQIAKFDLLIAAILLLASLALLRGNLVFAAVCLAVGLQIHEIAVIYGLPLFAALLYQGKQYKNMDLRSAGVACLIFGAGILLYIANLFLPHASGHFISGAIRSRLPSRYSFDSISTQFALLVITDNLRGEVDSMCTVTHSVHHYLKPFIALSMVALTGLSLSQGARLKWASLAIGTVLPILFLWITGTDMSRWTALAILNVWVLCAVRNFEPVDGVARRAWVRAACATAIIPLLFPLTVRVPLFIVYPSALIEGALEKIIGHPTINSLDECDPTWRAPFS